ncbi:Stress response protein nst1 [Coemansia sp. RSA 1365]|nr:Stress response protein nst1 [Coemansia sp. RSA 1365]
MNTSSSCMSSSSTKGIPASRGIPVVNGGNCNNNISGAIHVGRTAPAVYGPEPPPSMVRNKADTNAATAEIPGFPMMFRSEYGDDTFKSDNMKHIEAEMQQLFHSRLLTIMSEYGYKDSDFSEKEVANVMVARGLMKSPSDDPILALASEVKNEMWQIVHGNLKHMASAGVDPSHLAGIAADPIVLNTLVDMDRTYPDSDDLSDIGVSCEDIVRMMRGYSLSDLGSDFVVESAADVNGTLDHLSETGNVHESVSEPSYAYDLNQPCSEDPGELVDHSEPPGESKTQKKKKKRGKKKAKDKGKTIEDTEELAQSEPLVAPILDPNIQHQLPPQLPLTPVSSRQHGAQSRAPRSTRSTPTKMVDQKAHNAVENMPNNARKHGEVSGSLWNNYGTADHKEVRDFWLSLSEVEQQALVMVEKGVVLARVRDQQNFSCSCSTCTRKRDAIEHELHCLYDCYYGELKENARKANLRSWIISAKKKARSVILNSVEAITDSVVSELMVRSEVGTRESVQRTIIGCLKNSPEAKIIFGSEFYKLIELENALQNVSLSDSDDLKAAVSTQDPSADLAALPSLEERISSSFVKGGKGKETIESAATAIKEWTDSSAEYRRVLGDELLMCEDAAEESVNNNDLFYTEHMLDTIDTFPADSKKFFDMMERLAEYRVKREDAMLNALDGASIDDMEVHENDDFLPLDPLEDPDNDVLRLQRRCPDCHGEIGEAENEQLYSDLEDDPVDLYHSRKRARADSHSRYYDDAENEDDYEDEDEDDILLDNGQEDEDIDGTDDDFDSLDPVSAEKEIENGRKVFQLFAARLFEQRVINAYREKMAHDLQQDLINELEAEEKRLQAKDKRKQKRKQREREKKRQHQQQKEDGRVVKESQARVEEERRKVEAEKRSRELEEKRREEAIKARKAQEERNRRVLEQADKRLERERMEKLRVEQEAIEKEAREAMELNIRQQEAQKKASKQQRPKKQKQPAQTKQKEQQPIAPISSTPKRQPALPTPVSATKPTPTHTSGPTPVAVSAPVTASASLSAPVVVPALASATDLPSQSRIADSKMPVGAVAPLSSTPSAPVTPHAPETLMRSSVVQNNSIPLLDSLHSTPILAPASTFMNARTSLPMVHPHEARSITPVMPVFPSVRARANSGPSIQQLASSPSAPATAQTAKSMSASRDVPPEIDAEISSIVGRVMGTSILESDLIDGTEWRADPADRYAESFSRAAVLGMSEPPSLLADQAGRRNSMPANHHAHESGSAEHNGMHMLSSPVLGEEMERIHTAYNALEKFRRESSALSSSPSSIGAMHIQFGGYHSAAEIAQMHGQLKEAEVWSHCVAFAQKNATRCCLDYATRAVSFVMGSMSQLVEPRSTSLSQLPAIAEDVFGAFTLQAPLNESPQLADARAPLSSFSAYPPLHSSMLQSQMAPGLAPAHPHMAQPFGQNVQAGIGYTPVAPRPPGSLFFGSQSIHGSEQVFSAPPFQPSPHSSTGLVSRHPGNSPVASAMPPTAFTRQSRLALPVRATMFQSRTYVDKFQERETASENKYIHEKERAQLKSLYEKLNVAKDEVTRLSNHIKEKEEAANSKSKNDAENK